MGKKSITLSGLLNVIDGIETNYGRVLVLTTNRKDSLDPALVRPGRCDVHIEIGYCTLEHVVFLSNLYLGRAAEAIVCARAEELRFALDRNNVTPAVVAGMLLPLATASIRSAASLEADVSAFVDRLCCVIRDKCVEEDAESVLESEASSSVTVNR